MTCEVAWATVSNEIFVTFQIWKHATFTSRHHPPSFEHVYPVLCNIEQQCGISWDSVILLECATISIFCAGIAILFFWMQKDDLSSKNSLWKFMESWSTVGKQWVRNNSNLNPSHLWPRECGRHCAYQVSSASSKTREWHDAILSMRDKLFKTVLNEMVSFPVISESTNMWIKGWKFLLETLGKLAYESIN